MGIFGDMINNEREQQSIENMKTEFEKLLIMQRDHFLRRIEDIKKENMKKEMLYNEKDNHRLNSEPVYKQDYENKVLSSDGALWEHPAAKSVREWSDKKHKKDTYYILPNGKSFDLKEVVSIQWVDSAYYTPSILIDIRNSRLLCQKCANPIIMHDLCRKISELVKEAKE